VERGGEALLRAERLVLRLLRLLHAAADLTLPTLCRPQVHSAAGAARSAAARAAHRRSPAGSTLL
jgi:hypothetical protein